MESSEIFKNSSGFCSDCGSILPPIKSKGDLICFNCSKTYKAEDLENVKVKYTIVFNSIDTYEKSAKDARKQKEDGEEEEGPVVERKCPRCGNEKMSYATLQLRSADEGQTVFYTCTKCKFKETENS